MRVAITKQPSAIAPIGMSAAAVAVLAVAFLRHALVRQADENAYAHLWQILMAGQVPIVAWFVVRWLPRAPRVGLRVLALQIAAALAAIAPVWYLRL